MKNCAYSCLAFQQFDRHALPGCLMATCFAVKFSSPFVLKKVNDVL